MWGWTGLTGTTQIQTTNKGEVTTTEPVPVTLWNWIQVLIIPVVLAFAAYWLNQRQSSREHKAATQRAADEQLAADQRLQAERSITLDNQQAAVLDGYLDGMSDLLLNKNLRESKTDDEVRQVARAKTVTALRRLNPERKGQLLRFLFESGLIKKGTPIISLREADLSGADLREADLSGASLSGADLREASLSGADLREAELIRANLRGADLSMASLRGADLRGANLREADLSMASLSGAIVTEEQLSKAASLTGAILPDGSRHP